MMGQHTRSESLFYYFRLEDHVPENHLLRLRGLPHVKEQFFLAATYHEFFKHLKTFCKLRITSNPALRKGRRVLNISLVEIGMSGQNRERPRRKAEAALRLGPGHDD
jgi:hypothetical protein